MGGGRRDITHVDRPPIEDGESARQPSGDRDRLAERAHRGKRPVERHEPELIALDSVDLGIGRFAEPHGGPRDGLEDGGDVRGGGCGGGPGLTRPDPVAGGRRLRAASSPGCTNPHGTVSGSRASGPGVIQPATVDGPEGSPALAGGQAASADALHHGANLPDLANERGIRYRIIMCLFSAPLIALAGTDASNVTKHPSRRTASASK